MSITAVVLFVCSIFPLSCEPKSHFNALEIEFSSDLCALHTLPASRLSACIASLSVADAWWLLDDRPVHAPRTLPHQRSHALLCFPLQLILLMPLPCVARPIFNNFFLCVFFCFCFVLCFAAVWFCMLCCCRSIVPSHSPFLWYMYSNLLSSHACSCLYFQLTFEQSCAFCWSPGCVWSNPSVQLILVKMKKMKKKEREKNRYYGYGHHSLARHHGVPCWPLLDHVDEK